MKFTKKSEVCSSPDALMRSRPLQPRTTSAGQVTLNLGCRRMQPLVVALMPMGWPAAVPGRRRWPSSLSCRGASGGGGLWVARAGCSSRSLGSDGSAARYLIPRATAESISRNYRNEPAILEHGLGIRRMGARRDCVWDELARTQGHGLEPRTFERLLGARPPGACCQPRARVRTPVHAPSESRGGTARRRRGSPFRRGRL